MASVISDEEFKALHNALPDKQMDHPGQSSFWRRRAALMLGLRDQNAPWVDIIGEMEYREYQRDVKFSGELALRHLRIEAERRQAELELLRPVVDAAKAYREVFNTAKSALTITASRRELFRAVTALPAETWKPAEPWQTPGGLTPEDDPPQPIGDPPEDEETGAVTGECDHWMHKLDLPLGASMSMTAEAYEDFAAHSKICPQLAAAGAGQAGEEVGHG